MTQMTDCAMFGAMSWLMPIAGIGLLALAMLAGASLIKVWRR